MADNKVFSFRITPLRLAKVKAQAAVRGVTTTYLINVALEEYFQYHPLTDDEQVAFQVVLEKYWKKHGGPEDDE